MALTKITGEGVGAVDSLTVGTTAGDAGALLTINKSPVAAHGNPLVQVGGSTFTSGGYYTVGLGFTNSTYTEPPAEIAYVSQSDSGGTKGSIVFGTRDVTTNTAVTERMRIDSGGVVGIGLVPSGTEKLQVSGQIKASQDGSASAPAFVLNDGDTGLFRPSNNCIGFTTEGSEKVRIDNGGKLCVARTSGGANVNVQAASNNFFIELYNQSGSSVGSITTNGSSTAYNTTSDHRLKENTADMTGAIARVKQLAPKRFNFIAAADTTVDGFLAHEAQTVVPEAVTGTHNEIKTWTQQEIDDGDAPDGTSAGDNKLDGDGNTIPVMQGIDQSKLVPLLTGALQEAITKIETLETEMTALKARVTALEDA